MRNPFARVKTEPDPTTYVVLSGERYDLGEMRQHAENITNDPVENFDQSVAHGLAIALVAVIDKYNAQVQDSAA